MSLSLQDDSRLVNIWTGHRMIQNLRILSLVAGLFLLAGCNKKESAESAKATNSSASSGNPITAPVDYLGAVAKAKQSADKTLSTVGLNQTIQLFYAQEGHYPRTLNELVKPGYLSKLPEPPLGTKFDYNPNTGQVKVVPQ